MVNEGRPQPLHGRASGVLVDFAAWHRRALADPRTPGVIDAGEAMAAVPILLELAPLSGRMAMSLETIATVAGSRDGVAGDRPLRLFAAILRRFRRGAVPVPAAMGTVVETVPPEAA